MKLICNVCLSEQDAKVIDNYVHKLEQDFIIELGQLEDQLVKDHLKCLGWMLKNGTIEIKIAVIESKIGIQHEKIGILEDAQGNIISFTGSENETWMGWLGNNEKFHVFRSWNSGEKAHLESDLEDFDLYWGNLAKRAKVYAISDAVKKGLIRIAPTNNDELNTLAQRVLADAIAKNEDLIDTSTQRKEWRHKKIALETFLAKKNGIIQMATGTGKTSVAINILNRLLNDGKINGAIIATFGNDLLDQWYSELSEKANVELIIYRYYGEYHELEDFSINNEGAILLVNWENLHNIFKHSDSIADKLLIVDEVHGFGSESLRAALGGKIQTFQYRLGLSATSEREYDDAGNEFINKEIGDIIFDYGLKDAIQDGILCEFDYVPLSYHLSSEDKEAIQDAYKAYTGRIKNGQREKEAKIQLYMDLARVRKVSKNKLPIFREYIEQHADLLSNCIIFVETMEYGLLVQEIVINHTPTFHTYYADDEKRNLQKFADGELSLLVTCKRLSQGIDIRSIQNIILFSSSRVLLETIQRIGRCLRTDPNNLAKRATVIDFVVDADDRPEKEEHVDSDELREKMLTDLAKIRRK